MDDFHNQDNIYQACGLYDSVIVRDQEYKTKIQKRYLFQTLEETFELFKSEYPSVKLGSSKFCSLSYPISYCIQTHLQTSVGVFIMRI